MAPLAASATLAFAGGYCDASSYILANCFTGHITGNLVLAAISLAGRDHQNLAIRLVALAGFLAATGLGQLLRDRLKHATAWNALLVSLGMEAALVLLAPLPLRLGLHHALFVGCLCLAMGLQNGVFNKVGDTLVHTTYLSGVVTKMLSSVVAKSTQTAAHAETVTEAAKTKQTVRPILLVWGSLAVGAVCAGVLVPRFGPPAVWGLELPVLATAGIAFVARTREHSENRSGERA